MADRIARYIAKYYNKNSAAGHARYLDLSDEFRLCAVLSLHVDELLQSTKLRIQEVFTRDQKGLKPWAVGESPAADLDFYRFWDACEEAACMAGLDGVVSR